MTSTLDRRAFLKATGLSALTAAFARGAWADPRGGRRPNILFIMSDDHAAHAIGCYGSRINRTPSIDRIACEGMRFRDCFCTNAICAPSRAVILTGKYSHVNGVRDNATRFDGSQPTLPKLLQAAGYETAIIGKWHLQSDPTGFDHWRILPGQGEYHNPVFVEMGKRVKHEGYVTDLIGDFSIDWMRGRDTSRPFLLMCQHKAPHRNWQPAERHRGLYAREDVPRPKTLFDDYATRSDAARTTEMTVANHLTRDDLKGAVAPDGLSDRDRTEWNYQVYIKDYLRCVAAVDENVGRVLDYLDESGLAGNTLVIYTSDQGFFLGDHGWFDKRFMYEESLRMPLLVRWPGRIRPGSVNDELVLNLDFAPTFLDAAGLEPPSDMQGLSFGPMLCGRTPYYWRDAIYYRYYEYPAVHMVKRHYGVRTRRYKLIHFYEDIDAWEMYDLERDPHEVRNVFADPQYAAVRLDLERRLAALKERFADDTTP